MTRPLRVVAVPASHPYVRRVTADDAITLHDDPRPDGAGPGVWWPPVALDAAWIRAHADGADLLHIHFGTESFDVAHLVDAVDAAHAVGWPVVQTVHDLDHPQLADADQGRYVAQLDALLPRVDAVLTLTEGAAAEIARRWGVEAVVVPHPRLLGSDFTADTAPIGFAADGRVVGLHLKDLRPGVDGPGATTALVAALDLLRARGDAVTGEVRLHRSVRDSAARDEVRRLCAASDAVVLVEHDRLDDTALAAGLARLDACVLPYRHGTHSGWLELCWDLGVPVVAPDTGHYADQHDDPTVASARFAADGSALADALDGVLRAGARPGTTHRRDIITARSAERDRVDRDVVRAHLAVYRAALARPRARPAPSDPTIQPARRPAPPAERTPA
ncbi:glycosyltransferase [Frigoribacterium faeni]|uniref:glycosyltransferase n=1 Tax=Frigoribacterium faeni TaxID=145483 RepID=UPI001FADD5C3|nr:glycosyltransferase [Frigoribacterium faeni]MCJ0701615.1 glycosyltransferase [Frigoribacterium faeni]